MIRINFASWCQERRNILAATTPIVTPIISPIIASKKLTLPDSASNKTIPNKTEDITKYILNLNSNFLSMCFLCFFLSLYINKRYLKRWGSWTIAY